MLGWYVAFARTALTGQETQGHQFVSCEFPLSRLRWNLPMFFRSDLLEKELLRALFTGQFFFDLIEMSFGELVEF